MLGSLSLSFRPPVSLNLTMCSMAVCTSQVAERLSRAVYKGSPRPQQISSPHKYNPTNSSAQIINPSSKEHLLRSRCTSPPSPSLLSLPSAASLQPTAARRASCTADAVYSTKVNAFHPHKLLRTYTHPLHRQLLRRDLNRAQERPPVDRPGSRERLLVRMRWMHRHAVPEVLWGWKVR